MLNISLALLICAFVTPFALLVEPSSKGFRKRYYKKTFTSYLALHFLIFSIFYNGLMRICFKLIFSCRFTQVLSYLFNPITLLFIALIILTRWTIGELPIYPLLQRSLTAAMDALTYSIIDSAVSSRNFLHSGDWWNKLPMITTTMFNWFQIYGNWLYPLISLIFYPIWMQFFGILCIREDIQPKKETKIKLNWSHIFVHYKCHFKLSNSIKVYIINQKNC